MLKRRVFAWLSVGMLVAGMMSVCRVAAEADSPSFAVMNTSEYLPDGVYFRNSTDWNDTSRVTGWGVYAGDVIQLQCYGWGSNVPRRDGGTNTLWYIANNRTRPTAPGPRANAGWINAHFLNDGTGPNQTAPGVPACVNGRPPTAPPPPPPPPTVTAVYYAPTPDRVVWQTPSMSPNALVIPTSSWVSTNECQTTRADDAVPATATTLAGGSLGRLGPIYFLSQANTATKQRIKYVLMIDPGDSSDLSGCDTRAAAGTVLAQWLKVNRSAQLVILSGSQTGKQSAKGIQDVYFKPIRAAQAADGIDRRSRITVCNYSAGHDDMFRGGNYYIQRMPLTPCPRLDYATQLAPTGGWHP